MSNKNTSRDKKCMMFTTRQIDKVCVMFSIVLQLTLTCLSRD